jgi:restriction system protein
MFAGFGQRSKRLWSELAYIQSPCGPLNNPPGVLVSCSSDGCKGSMSAFAQIITSDEPPDWRPLQHEVARILHECGLTVEVEKTVRTGRGRLAVIDVYAEETVEGRSLGIACQCKHWSTRVSPAVFHSFSTEIAELGIDVGYIISKRGSQGETLSGADFANVGLLTWEEFQTEFFSTWARAFLEPYIHERFRNFIALTDWTSTHWYSVKDEDKAKLNKLHEKYGGLGFLFVILGPAGHILRGDEPVPSLPLAESGLNYLALDEVPKELLNARGYRQFLEQAEQYTDAAVTEFFSIQDLSGLASITAGGLPHSR